MDLLEHHNALFITAPVFFSLLFCFLLRKFAPQLNLLDHSAIGTRKSHTGKPAQVGGIAIFLSLLTVFLLGFGIPSALVIAMALFLILGVYDDACHIPAIQKLILQVVITCIIIAGLNLKLTNLGYFVDTNTLFTLNDWSMPLTLIAIIAFINAFNLIDGLDGLAGGIAIVTLVCFAFVSNSAGLSAYTVIFLIIIGAVLGFLLLNMRSPLRRKAIIFLGDGGSLSLAFALSWGAIKLANLFPQHSDTMPEPMILAFFMAYPIYDMLSVTTIRRMKGAPIFQPDTLHLHFLLKSTTRSDGKVCLILMGLHGIYCGAGMMAWKLGTSAFPLIFLWGALAGVHFAIYRLVLKG